MKMTHIVFLWLFLLFLGIGSQAHVTFSSAPLPISFEAQIGLEAPKSSSDCESIDILNLPSTAVKIQIHAEPPQKADPFMDMHRVTLPTQSGSEQASSPTRHDFEIIYGSMLSSESPDSLNAPAGTVWRFDPDTKTVEELVVDRSADANRNFVIQPEKKSDTCLAQLQLLRALAAKNLEQARVHGPKLLFMDIHGCEVGDMDQVKDAVEHVSKLSKTKSKRALMNVEFVTPGEGKSFVLLEKAVSRRRLESSSGIRPSDYVMMAWTGAILIVISFFIFCCIPWAPVLDPLLLSALKTDGKQD